MNRRVPNDAVDALTMEAWVWPLTRFELMRQILFGYKRCEICCNGEHTTAQCWVRYVTGQRR
jgi:hypothetical protein